MLEEILKRRSCRKFDPTKEVKKEDLNKVIEAGLNAPSGMNRQEGIIIAITNKEIRDAYSKANSLVMGREGDPFYGAPVILVVIHKKGFLADVNGAVMIENMLLEATHLGLASIWIHRAKEQIASEESRKLLSSTGLNFDEYEGIGHVALGYDGGFEYLPKVIKEGRVFYIK